MAAGRPTKYKPEYAEQARNYCLLGAKDIQLADFFGVSEQTIYTWKKQHPEFLEAIKEGKERADAEIAFSLFHRAKGYSHPEDKIFQSGGEEGKPLIVPTIKHYPPDTTAAIFWLKNRRSEDWRDRKELEVTKKNDPSELTDEELSDIATGSRSGASSEKESTDQLH